MANPSGFGRVLLTLVIFGVAVGATPCRAESGIDHRAELRGQFEQLAQEMKDRTWCDRVAGQSLHPAALIAPVDRDPAEVVLRRTRALLDHLERNGKDAAWKRFAAELSKLESRAKLVDAADAGARYGLYEDACRLRRRVAFSNPLLDFERLVFLTKHRPYRGDHHMVDQYCGFNGKPGGSVYVLEGPWSDRPRARDIMEERTAGNGRLKGKSLNGGVFNTLELDYDGKTLLFAYCEAGEMPASPDWSAQPLGWDAATANKLRKDYYYWSPERTYHVFKASVDGADAIQLTDGSFNDFDPCFLPNGRIAFVSERRGGFLRCGGNRPNPVFTLYSMQSDGGGIIPLSFHETQEWNPSVDNDGMIAYTRWDYVDRDNDGAHHLWLCYPDGRDPRAYHGNYPLLRESRPWLEIGIRAVPGSRKYVAVAGPHHGYAYGSLVLIDQGVEDDGAMSQVRRITPEAHFHESESAPGLPHKKGRHKPGGEFFGTPWPLGEMFHLCVYDRGQRHYGIYLIDAFGNRELLWRDPAVACLDPIPLRARTRPPVIPSQTAQAESRRPIQPSDTGTVLVMNIYESDFKWPKDTKISALRVVQLFPKATWHMDKPMVGVGRESLVRGVLGEAPVEKDGSVYFEAPAGVPIYFQALDEHGLAVQSMRSATYLHPGEQLTCAGCHESKWRTVSAPAATPLAVQRPPTRLVPPPEADQSVSFTRLVQPVLDRHCVDCHAKEKSAAALPLDARISNKHGWSRAYTSLAKYAWAFNGSNGIIFKEGMRSIPGKLGARASKLWSVLKDGHYDVKLPPEDKKSLILWLDLNSNFYGDYTDLKRQQRGEKVVPGLR